MQSDSSRQNKLFCPPSLSELPNQFHRLTIHTVSFHLQVFKEDTVSGIPGEKVISMDLPLNLLTPAKMNFITLDNPTVIKG